MKCDKDNNIEVFDCERGFAFNERLQICEKSRDSEDCFGSNSLEIDLIYLIGNRTSNIIKIFLI